MPRPYDTEKTVRYLTAATELGHRYVVLAYLGVYAGLRVHEAAKLAWGDVTGRYLAISGKGGKERHVPLHPELHRVLDVWRKDCPSRRWVLPPKESCGPRLLKSGRTVARNHLTWSPETVRAVRPTTAWLWHQHILERAGIREEG